MRISIRTRSCALLIYYVKSLGKFVFIHSDFLSDTRTLIFLLYFWTMYSAVNYAFRLYVSVTRLIWPTIR